LVLEKVFQKGKELYIKAGLKLNAENLAAPDGNQINIDLGIEGGW